MLNKTTTAYTVITVAKGIYFKLQIMQKAPKTLVIIGGGFAGIQLARQLANTYFHIIIIDKENHHMFQPLFYQVASARLEPSNISFPFRKVFQKSKNVEFRLGEVSKIDDEKNEVQSSAGTFKFDYLVIATGCTTNYFGNAQLQKNTLAMKSTGQAINIRNALLLQFEKFINDPGTVNKGVLNFVIVGGGATGVELAGAFAEMKKYSLPRDYPFNDFSAMRVILIEGGNYTLAAMSENARKYSREFLEQLGVEVKTNMAVDTYDGEQLLFKNAKPLLTQTVIWAAGVTGNVIEGLNHAELIRNRYKVDRFNRIVGYQTIFALGDIAYMCTALYPNAHPQLANVAINQAKNLATNLSKADSNWKEYEYKDLGSMATVGKHKAVVDLSFAKFGGRMAWFIWMFLHLMLILSVRNKLKIFMNWSWNYLVNDSSLRLIFKLPPKQK